MTMQSTVSESKYIRNKVTGQIVLNGFELVGFENYTPNYVPRVFKSSFKRANKITLEKQLEKPSMPKGNIWKKQNATTKKEWRNSRSLFGSLGISRKDTNNNLSKIVILLLSLLL